MAIDGDLKMGDVIGGNGYMNNHTISKQDWYYKNGDIISGNGFTNSHTLSQCNDSINFKDMYVGVEVDDVSSRYDYMNSHTIYQNIFLNNWLIIMIGMI